MSSESGVSRRGFLVLIGGVAVGSYALPATAAEATTGAEAAAGVASAATRKLLGKPLRQWQAGRAFASTGEPAFFLLWVEEGPSGKPTTMIWTPETPEEIAEARRFYEEARNFNAAGPAEPLPPLDPEEEALAEAVLDNLDDDAPRLAYAGYLRRRGSSQGEFVEIWCHTETMADDDPAKPALGERWADLLAEDAEGWLGPVLAMGLRPEIMGIFYPALWLFPRGLVEEVEIDKPGILPEQAEQLVRAAPVLNRLRFNYDSVDVAALAACPFLARVSDLEMSSLGLDLDAVRPLLESPYLLRLRRLDLGFNPLGPDFGPALAAAGFLPRLRTLDLRSVRLGAGGVELFRAWREGGLTTLDLADNGLDGEALAALASCPAARRLTSLKLSDNDLTAAHVEALAAAPFLATLTELHLDRCALDAAALAALAKLPLPALRHLKLSSNRLQEAGAKALAAAAWPALAHLELERCELGDAGLVALAGAPLLAGLAELSLAENRLGPRGVAALAAVPWAGRLRVLNLRANRCAEEGAKALAGCAGLAGLEELDLEENNLGAVGAGALAASPHLAGLKKLAATAKFLGPTGKAVLLRRFGDEVAQIDEGD